MPKTQYIVRFQVDRQLKFPPEGSESLAAKYAGAQTHRQAAAVVQRRIQEDADGKYRYQILNGTKPKSIMAQVHQLGAGI